VKKILFTKSGTKGWYVEVHIEYLIRYLSDEFIIEQADIPFKPYKDFLDRFPETSPLEKNPDDYDFIIPELGTHPHVSTEDYGEKMSCLSWEGLEGYHDKMRFGGAMSPDSEKAYRDSNVPYHSLRIGIDSELFKSIPTAREDDLLNVGFVGSIGNPRHRAIDIYRTLKDVEGIRLMFFPSVWNNNNQEITQYGVDADGNSINDNEIKEFIKYIYGGNKRWVGVPNCYNQLDVLVRVEQNEEYGFPVLEAAACGVPVIATDWGNVKSILDAGGGIRIERILTIKEQMQKMKDAIIEMKEKPEWRKHLGELGRAEIERNWTWDKQLDNWRKFFREGANGQKRH